MSTKTFNVSMSVDLVKQIDRQSKLQGSNRSDFIRQAVRRQLSAIEQWQALSLAVRKNYSGASLSEEQVAKLVQGERKK